MAYSCRINTLPASAKRPTARNLYGGRKTSLSAFRWIAFSERDAPASLGGAFEGRDIHRGVSDFSWKSRRRGRRVFSAVNANAATSSPARAGTLRSAVARLPLGQTGIAASRVGLGVGTRGWLGQSNQTRLGREGFIRLVRHALDRGINFFDAAELYGSHELLRAALKGVRRDQVVIQTKIWWQSAGMPEPTTDAKEALGRFCRELGADYVDIVLLHAAEKPSWPTDLRPMLEQLEELKERGVIRAHGASFHGLGALQTATVARWAEVMLVRVNHRGRNMDARPAVVAPLLQRARAAGRAVIGMKIFGDGALVSPAQREASLRFVLRSQLLDTLIVGFERPAEIDDTLQMVEKVLAANS
ncbi:MAG: aldo/keto reductase [Verrucomicrobiae bacterium]|nr:aldo/keto reductase [Verrucomicrobiae bacterium]